MPNRKMSYEDALYEMKLGKTVARKAWSDTAPQIWVFMVPEAGFQVPHKFGGGYRVLSTFWIKTAEDALMPWVIAHDDMTAEDWTVVDSPVREDQLKIRQA